MRKVSDWLSGFLEYSENTEPKESFRLWVGISTIAAALQRKSRLSWGTITFYPNMYIVLVGPSGSRKGTAMDLSAPFIRSLGIRMASEAITREALIRELRTSSNSQVDSSGKPVIHSSLTVFSYELVVFLGYNNVQLMADLCDWYDCKPTWTYRTKNAGTDEIIGVWVNLLGAITPDLLRSAIPLDAIGGGLFSRMILIYERRKARSVTRPFLSARAEQLRSYLLSDLERIMMMSGDFTPTREFLEYWDEWYPKQDQNPPFDDPRFDGYMQRRPTHVLKLSMIMSASERDDMILDIPQLERSIKILTDVETRMPYIFSGIGKSKISDVLIKVWGFIALRKQTSASEILRSFHYDLDIDDLNIITRTLEAMKVISVTYTPKDTFIKYLGTKELEEKYGITK